MTAGYGDGRVTIGRYSVGRVAVTTVAAVPALGPRIRFGLSWTLGHLVRSGEGRPPEEYQVIDFGGELRIRAEDRRARRRRAAVDSGHPARGDGHWEERAGTDARRRESNRGDGLGLRWCCGWRGASVPPRCCRSRARRMT